MLSTQKPLLSTQIEAVNAKLLFTEEVKAHSGPVYRTPQPELEITSCRPVHAMASVFLYWRTFSWPKLGLAKITSSLCPRSDLQSMREKSWINVPASLGCRRQFCHVFSPWEYLQKEHRFTVEGTHSIMFPLSAFLPFLSHAPIPSQSFLLIKLLDYLCSFLISESAWVDSKLRTSGILISSTQLHCSDSICPGVLAGACQ